MNENLMNETGLCRKIEKNFSLFIPKTMIFKILRLKCEINLFVITIEDCDVCNYKTENHKQKFNKIYKIFK